LSEALQAEIIKRNTRREKLLGTYYFRTSRDCIIRETIPCVLQAEVVRDEGLDDLAL
jgi:hypothetical protein